MSERQGTLLSQASIQCGQPAELLPEPRKGTWSVTDRLVIRARAQPQERPPGAAPQRPDRVHGPVRVGQVLACLRHHLRRGPAPLGRVAVGLRPPVPRPDGEAGRRLHRGAVAGHLDRPEVDLQEPPLHRRDDHRGLRLPAAAVRPHRPAHCPSAAAPSPARPPTRSSTRSWSCRRHPLPAAGPGGPGPQGRVRSCCAASRPRGSPGPGWTARSATCRSRSWLAKTYKHDIEIVVDRPRRPRPRGRREGRRCLADSVETAVGLSEGLVVVELVDEAASCSSPPTWPASTTTCRSRSRRRATSPSTPPTGPARTAPAWGSSRRSTPSWSSPTRACP